MKSAALPRFIICESTPRWAVISRRLRPDMGVSEARSFSLADDLLRASPTSVVALAVDETNAATALRQLSTWQRLYRDCVTAVLIDQCDDEWECGFREASAQFVSDSLFELPQLVRLAAGDFHLSRTASV